MSRPGRHLKRCRSVNSATPPAEVTNEPLIVDRRNYYKVEKWTKDGAKVDRILYAAIISIRRDVFARAIKHRRGSD